MKSPDQEEVRSLAQSLADMLVSHDRGVAMRALERMLPIVWANNDKYKIVTEAVDEWRAFASKIEGDIKQCFGDVRYGEKQ